MFISTEGEENLEGDSSSNHYGTVGRRKAVKELRVLDQKAAQNLCEVPHNHVWRGTANRFFLMLQQLSSDQPR